jgi:hypothetical protein
VAVLLVFYGERYQSRWSHTKKKLGVRRGGAKQDEENGEEWWICDQRYALFDVPSFHDILTGDYLVRDTRRRR